MCVWSGAIENQTMCPKLGKYFTSTASQSPRHNQHMAALCDTIRAAHAAYSSAGDPDLVVPSLRDGDVYYTPKMWWEEIIPRSRKSDATRTTRALVVANLVPATDCVVCGDHACLAQCPPHTLYQLALAAPDVLALFRVFQNNGGLPWGTSAGMMMVARWAMRGREDIVLVARLYGLDPFCVVDMTDTQFGDCSVVSLIAKKFVASAHKFSASAANTIVSPTLFNLGTCSYDTTCFGKLVAESRAVHPGQHDEEFECAALALARIGIIVEEKAM